MESCKRCCCVGAFNSGRTATSDIVMSCLRPGSGIAVRKAHHIYDDRKDRHIHAYAATLEMCFIGDSWGNYLTLINALLKVSFAVEVR